MTSTGRCTPGGTISPAANPRRSGFPRRVLDDYPAFVVLHHLDELKVAQAIRHNPRCGWLVVQNGTKVTLEEAS
jgi:hypothetical protein